MLGLERQRIVFERYQKARRRQRDYMEGADSGVH